MTKEIISTTKENPKTKIGWWAFWLSMVTIMSGPILGTFAAVFSPLLTSATSEKVGIIAGFLVMAIVAVVFLAALTTSIIAFRKGERSWMVRVALTLSIIQACFLIFMIVGEFLFPH